MRSTQMFGEAGACLHCGHTVYDGPRGGLAQRDRESRTPPRRVIPPSGGIVESADGYIYDFSRFWP